MRKGASENKSMPPEVAIQMKAARIPLSDRQRRFRFHMRDWAHKWRTSGRDQLVRDHTLLNAIHCRRLAQNETTVGFHGL